MTPPDVLRLILALAPRAPLARVAPFAEAIAFVAADARQASELVAIAFYESTFGRAGRPFGLSAFDLRGLSLVAHAMTAARVLDRGRRICGPSLEARHHFFRTGTCARPDRQAERRARTTRRLLRHRALR